MSSLPTAVQTALCLMPNAVLQVVLIDGKPVIVLQHVRKQCEWHHNSGRSLMGAKPEKSKSYPWTHETEFK